MASEEMTCENCGQPMAVAAGESDGEELCTDCMSDAWTAWVNEQASRVALEVQQ